MAIPTTNTQQQWIPAQDRVSNFPPWVEEVPRGLTLSWGAMDCSWLLIVYVCGGVTFFNGHRGTIWEEESSKGGEEGRKRAVRDACDHSVYELSVIKK